MTLLSKENDSFETPSESGYPQGKNRSPARMRASVRKATRSLPWSQALAPVRSVFRRCPSPMMDFNRLKTISICQRPRYASKTLAGLNFRSRVVNTKIYPAASSVSGWTVVPLRLYSRRSFRRALSAASLLFFTAQTLPGIKAFSKGIQTFQSPSFVFVSVLKCRSKGKKTSFSFTNGRFVKFIRTSTWPPPFTTWWIPARWAKPRSPKNKSPGWTLKRLKDSPSSGLVTKTSSHCKEGNPME